MSLSDFIVKDVEVKREKHLLEYEDVVCVKDVRRFIKELKEEFPIMLDEKEKTVTMIDIIELIDLLVGEVLK